MSRALPLTAARLRAPSDGIVASQRPKGPLARQWLRLLRRLAEQYPDRLARGRGFARSGRVRDLWLSPGLANAEVVVRDVRHVTLRVRVFDEAHWKKAIDNLSRDLQAIASLLEGQLTTRSIAAFKAAGVPLLPEPGEVDGVCDCGDFAMPCSHMAAVHVVLAEALEGEPFLLLTLRGRPREQVLAALRERWGDPEPLRPPVTDPLEEAPAGPWFDSPEPLGSLRFAFHGHDATPGLLELGPPPGQADLEQALLPLYEAGRNAAVELALREASAIGPPLRIRTLPPADSAGTTPAPHVPPPEVPMAQSAEALTETVVDALATSDEGVKSTDLAAMIGVGLVELRQELIALEKLGIVLRTGRTRGTRWWLG